MSTISLRYMSAKNVLIKNKLIEKPGAVFIYNVLISVIYSLMVSHVSEIITKEHIFATHYKLNFFV